MASTNDTVQNVAKSKAPEKTIPGKERNPGIWYLIAGLVAIFFMLIGMGVFPFFEGQLSEIYNTALTLCLSCIGLGEINMLILGTIAFTFVLFMLLYALTKHDKAGAKK